MWRGLVRRDSVPVVPGKTWPPALQPRSLQATCSCGSKPHSWWMRKPFLAGNCRRRPLIRQSRWVAASSRRCKGTRMKRKGQSNYCVRSRVPCRFPYLRCDQGGVRLMHHASLRVQGLHRWPRFRSSLVNLRSRSRRAGSKKAFAPSKSPR